MRKLIALIGITLQIACNNAGMNTTSSSDKGNGGSADILNKAVTLETGVSNPATKVSLQAPGVYCINSKNVIVAYTRFEGAYFTNNTNYYETDEILIDSANNLTMTFWTNKGNPHETWSKLTAKLTFDPVTRTVLKSNQTMVSQMTPWTVRRIVNSIGTTTSNTFNTLDFSFAAFNGAVANETVPYIMFYWPGDDQHINLNLGIALKGLYSSLDPSAPCYQVVSH